MVLGWRRRRRRSESRQARKGHKNYKRAISHTPTDPHHASYKGIKHRALSAMKRSERLKARGVVKIIRLCVGRTTGVCGAVK